MEEARPGQLVKREVTQILSPGHALRRTDAGGGAEQLSRGCLPSRWQGFGLAVVDLTTGDFKTTEVESDTALLAELERLRPAEIIYPGRKRRVSARNAAKAGFRMC